MTFVMLGVMVVAVLAKISCKWRKLPEEEYDLATAFETIYFWPGLKNCFAQVAKVLKPGGIFMIVNESDGTDETSLKFEKIIDGMKLDWVRNCGERFHMYDLIKDC